MDDRKEILKLLLDVYVRLLEMYTSPGEKSHMLSHHTDVIKRQILLILKESKNG